MASDAAKSFITGFAQQELKQIEETKADAKKEYDRTQALAQSLALEEYKTQKQKRDNNLAFAEKLEAAGNTRLRAQLILTQNGHNSADVNYYTGDKYWSSEEGQALAKAVEEKYSEHVSWLRGTPETTFSVAQSADKRKEYVDHAVRGTGLMGWFNAKVGGTATRMGNTPSPERLESISKEFLYQGEDTRGTSSLTEAMTALQLGAPPKDKEKPNTVTVGDQVLQLIAGEDGTTTAKVLFDASKPEEAKESIFTLLTPSGKEVKQDFADILKDFQGAFNMGEKATEWHSWRKANPAKYAKMVEANKQGRSYSVYDYMKDEGYVEFQDADVSTMPPPEGGTLPLEAVDTGAAMPTEEPAPTTKPEAPEVQYTVIEGFPEEPPVTDRGGIVFRTPDGKLQTIPAENYEGLKKVPGITLVDTSVPENTAPSATAIPPSTTYKDVQDVIKMAEDADNLTPSLARTQLKKLRPLDGKMGQDNYAVRQLIRKLERVEVSKVDPATLTLEESIADIERKLEGTSDPKERDALIQQLNSLNREQAKRES